MSISYITEESPAGDFEKIAVSTGVVGPTAAKLEIGRPGGFHKRAIRIFVTVETNSVRMRWDGTVPDATTGHLLAAGDSIYLEGESNVGNLKMIRATADAVVSITYYYNI